MSDHHHHPRGDDHPPGHDPHHHEGEQPHTHHPTTGCVVPALDGSVADGDLSPAELNRRDFLRATGLLGAGTAATVLGTPEPAAAVTGDRAARTGGFHWLAGDHHIHTQYSFDGMYRVTDQVRQARAYGLDWMVITDHGGAGHLRIGVDRVNPDIVAARREFPDALVFQGLEWNIPAAEHGTVFVHPGRSEVAVLKQFEADYDGSINQAGANTSANQALALTALSSLSRAVRAGRVADAVMLANHPSRNGLDSPHELRNWRDRAPEIAIGMEGAPGHQAAGLPTPYGPGGSRGYYNLAPNPDVAFPGYPAETYRSFGGFDWMTATVGGLWDSMLSEGRPWWITVNSDSHAVFNDTSQTPNDSDFNANGYVSDPVYRAEPMRTAGDFWPGYYSRTTVGCSDFGYGAVMAGLRAGRVWVDHGGLIDSVDVRLRGGGREVPLGGVLRAQRGTEVQLLVRIRPARRPNWSQFVPQLAQLDIIQGAVTGPVQDRDTFRAPGTRVVRSYDVHDQRPTITLRYNLGPLTEGLYVRLRGSDGNRLAPGLYGVAVDPAGPVADERGNADPWQDLWFYTNPMWALPLD